MKKGRLQSIYANDAESRVANIILKIVYAILAAYLVVIVVGAILGDMKLLLTTAAAILMLLIPWVMLMRGWLRASGDILVLNVLLVATIFATNGQGYHDIVTMTFPVIIVIASLLVPQRDFFWISLTTIGAVAWLVFGEAFGMFAPAPNTTPPFADFIMITVILLVAIIAVGMLTENIHRSSRIAEQEISSRKTIESELRYQSTHDSLTGIYNRAFFDEAMERMELEQQYPVSIIAADVDRLKRINDTQGHVMGDDLLYNVAQLLASVFRSDDVLARIGGDEFAILLPRTDPETVTRVVNRVQTIILEYNKSHPDQAIQLSIGYSTSAQGNLIAAYKVADEEMYADKLKRRK